MKSIKISYVWWEHGSDKPKSSPCLATVSISERDLVFPILHYLAKSFRGAKYGVVFEYDKKKFIVFPNNLRVSQKDMKIIRDFIDKEWYKVIRHK